MAVDLNKIVEDLSALTIMEAAELSKMLEDKWGVSASMPVAMAMPAGGGAVAAEEKTEFDVHLTNVGDKKIEVIKVVRGATSLGLAEAKALVEKGGLIKEAMAKAEADKLKAELEKAGAKVELK